MNQMRPFTIDPATLTSDIDLSGVILCEEARVGGRRIFFKGHRLTAGDFSLLQQAERPMHALHLDPGDIHEDDAAIRLAAALAGDGVISKGPVQSRVNLVATCKGLLRVDQAKLMALNLLPDIAIFTLLDRLPVLPGKVVAGVKITPVATAESNLRQAEAIASGTPVIEVKPFLPLKVGIVTTEGMNDKTRSRFRNTVRNKLAWYGASVLAFADLQHDQEAVAQAIEQFISDGADLVLTGGGNTIDPLDATLQALTTIDAELVRFGAPAHPGSMFWLAYRRETPIFNLASCSLYSKATVADLVLPWIMAGERVTGDDIAALGYGGLLDREMQFRFPPYDPGESDISDGEV